MNEFDRNYILKQLDGAPVRLEPFSHFFIENIFPDSFYQKLIQSFPDPDLYRYSESNDRRWVFTIDPENLSRLPLEEKLFWEKVSGFLSGDLFIRAILKKFQPFEPVQKALERTDLYGVLQLTQDTANYSVEPHTDHPRKVATLLFYFPLSQDQSHFGTAIYRPKDRAFTCKGMYRYPFENFDLVWKAPFLPNSVFGFFKTDDSFHGVEPTGINQTDRNLLAYTIWKNE